MTQGSLSEFIVRSALYPDVKLASFLLGYGYSYFFVYLARVAQKIKVEGNET